MLMSMKNLDILVMINSGISNITNYDLSAANAYKVMKFRNLVTKKFDEIQEQEKKLLADAGIDDPQGFDARFKELREKENRTEEENKEFAEYTDKYNAWVKARTDMLNSDVELEGVKTISFEDWHNLRKENRPSDANKVDPLNNYVESILENVLWKAPEDEE